MMAVFTPMSLPAESSRGPPELPGLMAASVWIASAISRPALVGKRRPNALTTPVDRLRDSPKGLPIANTACPIFRLAERPTGIGLGVEVPGLGPFRVDYGYPLNPEDFQSSSGRLHLLSALRF